MTCALEGVYLTNDGLFMCDGETHITIHQADGDAPAVYRYAPCPDWVMPDGPPLRGREAAAVYGTCAVAMLLWSWLAVLVVRAVWGMAS